MKKFAFILLATFWLCQNISAQNRPYFTDKLSDAPVWVKMMDSDHPNVFEIQHAYREYFKDKPYEKNSYTQFFKRWMQWARPFTDGDGFLNIPSVEAQQSFENQLLNERNNDADAAKRGVLAGSWTFAGPKKHLHDDGLQTPISRHTNIYSFDIAPSNNSILYAGGESGGLWKTTDKGLNWTLLTKNMTHGAFGAVEIHPNDPNTVWAGTSGKIVKTIDGGTNWTTAFSLNGLWVNDFAVSTSNPLIVMAACDGGFYRSTNGGTTWTLLFSNRTWTIKQKIGDGATFYAVRKNGASSQFVRSTDSGATWSVVGNGWYATAGAEDISGALIATCPSNVSKLYVYLMGDNGNLGGYVGVFVSSDGGTNWANTHPSNAIGTPYSIPNHVNLMDADGVDWFYQGFYDSGITVNPANENELIAGGCSWWKSINGGQTWTAFGGYVGNQTGYRHPDVQQISWVGSDLWIASDGGLDYSSNAGTTTQSRNNGISGADLWGFDSGWNDDIMVGGRYHNGNMAYYSGYPAGSFLALGGAEAATGYVNPGPGRKTYHSDIGGYKIPATLTGTPTYFSVSDWPNESYAYYQNSEMVWHPNCWSIVFLGKENKLWKSLDGGSTFSVVYTFPGAADKEVFEIEISRSNPQIMYVSQWNGTDDMIYKSTNGGTTFTLCTALPLPNNNDRIKLALSDSDPNILWASVTYGSNGKKVYKTTNGGSTWTNLTTAILDGKTVQNIMAQYGTNGGVYIGTNGGVFYRNNTHSDWQPFSDGLPLSAETNRLKPFYKTGKIRNGCWSFGVWESPLFETSVPKANAMANKLYSGCQRDTFYFDDYSNVNHTGATWFWQFPGAVWKSDSTTRNPRAFFPASGNYQAIMALTYSGTTTYDTLNLTVGSECAADSIPGKAVRLGGNSAESSVVIPPLNVNTNTFSVSAWVKPDGIQPDYASIFMHDGVSAGLHFQPGNNHLGYHWPGGAWWWDSGLEVPSGQWSHVALVVAPTSVTIYLNGVPAQHSGLTLTKVNFTSNSQLGSYKDWGGRFVKGDLDEVCIFNKSLTQIEVREKMNLRKIPTAETKMLAYFQFNEPSGNTVFDRAATLHASLSGAASRINSTVAIGPGKAKRLTIATGGTKNFGSLVNVIAYWPTTGTFPAGEVVATRINLAPDQNPNTDPISTGYWVVRNYGTNQNFTNLTKIVFQKIGNVPANTTANQYKLFRRTANGEGATWNLQDIGDLRTVGTNGAVTFSTGNNLTSFGSQFIITKPPGAVPPNFEISERKNETAVEISNQFEVEISPNPVSSNGVLKIRTNLEGEARFKLFDEKGRAVRLEKFVGETAVNLNNLPAGVYFYRVENEVFMANGRVVVE